MTTYHFSETDRPMPKARKPVLEVSAPKIGIYRGEIITSAMVRSFSPVRLIQMVELLGLPIAPLEYSREDLAEQCIACMHFPKGTP